jgi:hypothetical protein
VTHEFSGLKFYQSYVAFAPWGASRSPMPE